jgi:hypothetical protein
VIRRSRPSSDAHRFATPDAGFVNQQEQPTAPGHARRAATISARNRNWLARELIRMSGDDAIPMDADTARARSMSCAACGN